MPDRTQAEADMQTTNELGQETPAFKEAPTLELRPSDRCDARCPAKAIYIVYVPVGEEALPLFLCSHHKNKHEATIVGAGASIVQGAEID